MTVKVPTWTEVTTGREAQDVVLARLQETAWLANLGQAANRDDEVLRVTTWREALRMFTEGVGRAPRPTGGSNTTGTVDGPFRLLLHRLNSERLEGAATVAADHALDVLLDDYYAVGPVPLPPGMDAFRTEASIGDYIAEFIRLLFIEIHVGDLAEPRCTYFRDQFGWFLAGFLPCGWDGAWPTGRMKVF